MSDQGWYWWRWPRKQTQSFTIFLSCYTADAYSLFCLLNVYILVPWSKKISFLLLHDSEINSPLSPQHMCNNSCESKALANDWLHYFIIEGSSLFSWSKGHSAHKCQGKHLGCSFLLSLESFWLKSSPIWEQCDIFSSRISVLMVTEG